MDVSEVFNDLRPRIKADGTPHYPGQIYDKKKYRERLLKQHPYCGICGGKIKNHKLATLDHIVPRLHGGHTTKDNIQLAHRKCNYRKGCEL